MTGDELACYRLAFETRRDPQLIDKQSTYETARQLAALKLLGNR